MSATASRPWSARLRIEASASQVAAAAIVAAFLLAFLVVPVGRVFLTAFAGPELRQFPLHRLEAAGRIAAVAVRHQMVDEPQKDIAHGTLSGL